MSKGTATQYLAWGKNIDMTGITEEEKAEKRTVDTITGGVREKIVTTAYVAGPYFRVEETDLVSFGVFVADKSTATTLQFIVEHSYDGENWAPQSAGKALALVGIAPADVLQSELKPFEKLWTIPAVAADQSIFFNYEQRAVFTRIKVKTDAGAPKIFIQAGV